MPASRSDITGWLADGVERGSRWMVVKCDTFDYRGGAHDNCCYPVYCATVGDVKEALGNADRTMEIYDLTVSIDGQMAEFRAWHPPQEIHV